jgi:Tol biopolymer transport system component
VTGPHGPRVWSARGDVAIAHRRGIMVRRASSGRRRLVLAARGRFRFGIPDWSPDGRRLAVARTDLRTGLSAVVDVSASGGRARVIVRACLAGDPVWSPSGSRLAFASTCLDEPSDEDAPSVYAVRPDGSRLRRLFDPTDLTPPEAAVARYVAPALSWQPRR